MLSFGNNIKQKDDKLQRTETEQVYQMLMNPKQQIIELIEHLRILMNIDIKAYRTQKTNLPYIVPSLFNPPFRRTENFAQSEFMIVDFDHLANFDLTAEQLKNNLKTDLQVHLMFTSPGGDGLKVLFRLAQKIYDHSKYKLYYQSFVKNFEKRNNLPLIADYSTCDVTRACFLSYDNEAYFNKNSELVEIEKFVDFDNFFEVKELQQEIKIQNTKLLPKIETGPDKDSFLEIKKLLNPKIAVKEERKKQVFVPDELSAIVEKLKEFLSDFNLKVERIDNLNYGKKFIVSYEHHKAEVNVFFGRKGFSVVRSPKNGTNQELMELTFSIINKFFDEYLSLK